MPVEPTSEWFPYDQPYWNVSDQHYWCKMNGYGFPTSRMLPKYAYIVEQKKCDTFEAEFQAYLAANPDAIIY